MNFPIPLSLSLREKIGQTCQFHGKEISRLSEDRRQAFLQESPVGSLFLGSEIIGSEGGGAERLREVIADCQSKSRIPLSIAGDLENGAGGAIRGLTAFPNLLALAAANDLEAAYDYGRWTAVEACRIGFNWTFGPVVDLCLNWLNPIVSTRSLGQSPERVAEFAAAIIRGCQDHGLSATAKHFPGDGVDFRDQHFCGSVNSLSESDWKQTFGLVYEACFAANVHSVMAGHVALPWIEEDTAFCRAPLPATTSGRILGDLLREKMGYNGVVVSDALIMAGFRGKSTRREDLMVEAFNAGIDVMLWPGADYFELMERALDSGRISEERLNQSVSRVLAMKARQGLFDSTAKVENGAQESPVIEISPAEPDAGAIRFAEELAEQSLTLVENRCGLLPLNPAAVRKIQVLLATPNEEDGPKRLGPLLECLRARGMTVDLHVNGNCLDLRHKEAAGERYDALIAVFDLWTHGLKNTMRPTGAMAECMWTIQGLETMRPIVISLGSPYLLHDMPWMDTYVNAYSRSAHTLRALGRALFGEIPFNGISPVDTRTSWIMADGRHSLPMIPELV